MSRLVSYIARQLASEGGTVDTPRDLELVCGDKVARSCQWDFRFRPLRTHSYRFRRGLALLIHWPASLRKRQAGVMRSLTPVEKPFC